MKLLKKSSPSSGESWRRLVLRGLAAGLYRHPFLALLGLALLTTLAAWRAARLEVTANLRAFVPMRPDEQAAWNSVNRLAPRHAPLIAVVELRSSLPGQAPRAARSSSLFVKAWTDPEFIASAQALPLADDTGTASIRTRNDADLLPTLLEPDVSLLDSMTRPAGALAALNDALGGNGGPPVAASADLAPDDPAGFFRALRERRDAARAGLSRRLFPETAQTSQSAILLFRLDPAQSSDELLYCVRLREFLVQTVQALKRRYPRDLAEAKVEFHGSHVETAQLASRLKSDAARSGLVLAFCLVLLMILAFRKVESILFIGLPPCIGLVWTFGLVSCFASSLSLLSALFGVLLAALGLEYAVQLHYRFVEELYRERRYYEALGAAYVETGRGAAVCTLATTLVFFSFYLSSFSALREIALVGGAGIVSMTAAVLLLSPPMAAVKRIVARGVVRPVETYGFGMSDLSAAVIASPRTALALGLIVTACLAYLGRDLRIRREVGLDLGPPPRQQTAVLQNGGQAEIEGDPLSIMVEGESLEQALRRNDRLYANLTAPPDAVAAWEIDSLSPILPSLARQREMRPLEQIDVAAVRRSLRIAARRLKLPPGAFAPFSDRLAAFQSAARAADPLELHDVADVDLLGRIQARAVHVGGVYRVLTVVHPLTESTKDLLSAFPSMQAKAGKGIDSAALRFDSEGLQNQRVSETVLYSMALMVLLATLSLLICLLPHFHGRLDRTLLAMLPLACATIWTLGFLAFLRLYIGLYSLLVFPLVIALAVDQAVLLIQRLGDRRYASLRQALRSGGRPNVVSGLALLLGLGCLGQINVPALQEMVLVSAAAIACSTVSTVVLIPALLQVREEGGLAAWRADSED